MHAWINYNKIVKNKQLFPYKNVHSYNVKKEPDIFKLWYKYHDRFSIDFAAKKLMILGEPEVPQTLFDNNKQNIK